MEAFGLAEGGVVRPAPNSVILTAPSLFARALLPGLCQRVLQVIDEDLCLPVFFGEDQI
jgi:hypothetical protein